MLEIPNILWPSLTSLLKNLRPETFVPLGVSTFNWTVQMTYLSITGLQSGRPIPRASTQSFTGYSHLSHD